MDGFLTLPVTSFNWPADALIYRIRCHDSNDVPQTVSEIYYPPRIDKISLGRANGWEHQVFYGVLTTGNPHARMAAYHEVSNEAQFSSTFTISRWRLRKELPNVLSLMMRESQCQGDPWAMKCFLHTMEYLETFPEPDRAEAKKALDAVGTMFSREVNDCDYWASAKFAMNIFSQGYSAILYPSVPYKYRAICIALQKQAADEFLEPLNGSLFQLHLDAGGITERVYKNFVVNGEDLIWSDDEEGLKVNPPYRQTFVRRNCSPCEAQRDKFFRNMVPSL